VATPTSEVEKMLSALAGEKFSILIAGKMSSGRIYLFITGTRNL
jgi:hypothetical protein